MEVAHMVRNHHHNLSLGVVHGLEVGHMKGLYQGNMKTFYTKLAKAYKAYNYQPNLIWNCDQCNT
jgi:hypothetical protein